MTKKEIIWREILFQATENKKFNFTQKELAQKYEFSLSTVFNALKAPRGVNAIEGQRGFELRDIEKFLYLWATFRNLEKDIIYETFVPKNIRETENEMPQSAIFGAYSAFLKKYGEAPPADYDRVYVYIPEDKIEEMKSRFPRSEKSKKAGGGKNYSNLVVLKADSFLSDFGVVTPDCQTFADLWNLPEWFAKDFINTIKDRLNI